MEIASEVPASLAHRCTPRTCRPPVLLLPPRKIPFEGAYIAAVAALTAVKARSSSRGTWATQPALRIRRCEELAEGALCLLIPKLDSSNEADPKTWSSATKLSTIQEILEASAFALDDQGIVDDGVTFDDAWMTVSQRIRQSQDNPAVLGPLVSELSAWLRKKSAQQACFFGGDRPSLLSDVPLAGALLTSQSWCRRVAAGNLEQLRASETPLKGLELVLKWLLSVLDASAGKQALAACRATAFQALSESDQFSFPEISSCRELESSIPETWPPDVLSYLSSLLPPPQSVCSEELLSPAELSTLAEMRRQTEIARAPLIDAVQRGDVNRVAELLEAGVSISASFRTKHHEVGLEHIAAAVGAAPPDRGSSVRDHPVKLIAKDLKVELFEERNPEAERCGLDILRLLVQARGSLEAKDSDGGTPAFYAAMVGNLSCLQYLLGSGGQKVFHHLDYLQRSVLYWATSNDQPSCVQWLLENVTGLEVDAQSKQRRTALAKAAWSDSPDIAGLLLAHRADPRIVDDHGRTVLHMAAWGEHGGRRGGKFVNGRPAGASPRCIRLLLESPEGKACMSVMDRDGGTPISIASATGAVSALQALLSTEVGRRQVLDPPPCLEDYVPLAASAFRGHADCLQTLLDAKGDPSLRGRLSGRSALDFAVVGQNSGTVEMLVEALLDLGIQDKLEPDHSSHGRIPYRSLDKQAERKSCVSDVHAVLEAGDRNFSNLSQDRFSSNSRHPLAAGCDELFPPNGIRLPSCIIEQFASAVRWAIYTGEANVLRTLVMACPETLLRVDFLELCLVNGPRKIAMVSWPPFPEIGSQKHMAWVPAEIALSGIPGLSDVLSCGLGSSSGMSAASLACCRALLAAKAQVHEGTLAGGLRHGLGGGSDSEANLLHGMLDNFLSSKPSSGVCPSLGWSLVAAAMANCSTAVRLLLAMRADPNACSRIAITAAASGGSKECLSQLIDSCGPGIVCPMGITAPISRHKTVSPLYVAACSGHAECLSYLIGLQTDSSQSIREAAEGAASAGHFDLAQWLRGSQYDRCASSSSTVLQFRLRQESDLSNLEKSRSNSSGYFGELSTKDFCDVTALTEVRNPQPLRDYIWVETLTDASTALEALNRDLKSCPVLGVDLESYDDVVCTVQLATTRRVLVIDSLRLHGRIAELLKRWFEDGSIVKVFHAPRNDLRWLQSNFALQVVNIFDTSLAAAHLQRGQNAGLKAVCAEFLHLDLDKKHQCSDWRLRPLPPAMLHYAALDAGVLLPLASTLCLQLMQEKGRLEACVAACNQHSSDNSSDSGSTQTVRVELL